MIPTSDTIQRASEILRQIESLQAELAGLFSGGRVVVATPKRRGRPPGSGKAAAAALAPEGAPKKRRKMSAEARARIAAAAKARWAKFHAERKSPAKG
jgi:sugar phosphate isomerase/epimerase